MFFVPPVNLHSNRLRLKIWIAVLSVISSGVFLHACTRAQPIVLANNPLEISLQTRDSYALGEAIPVTVTITNKTSQALYFLKWGTPFEKTLSRDIFNIRYKGKSLNYRGRMVKRGKPRAADYILIKPRQSLQATTDISQVYPLSKTGQYMVNYRDSIIDLQNVESAVDMKASNIATFTVY